MFLMVNNQSALAKSIFTYEHISLFFKYNYAGQEKAGKVLTTI